MVAFLRKLWAILSAQAPEEEWKIVRLPSGKLAKLTTGPDGKPEISALSKEEERIARQIDRAW